ncbi:DedA family protein [Caldimonas brevitalea]|uniref:Alkaline phosphatase n=1 Tax=Caldimonas brevitalea TaxID=413882 RepID=A0A0G3BJA4_9BURK|nr:DedA family protein [Caldimonas brevitalea]AKJ27451.1 alkaline phosphatase [Caldimonas brevitalea]
MADWIVQFIESHGYLGVALLMVAENVFPPIPSELIMPFAGYTAARGELTPLGVVLAGIAGSVLGTLAWYWAGRRIGSERLKQWADRHGRWLTVSADDIERADRWFDRHGHWSVATGRLVPAVRSVISAPAGISGMSFNRFLFWSVLGTAVWTGALTGVGYWLEDNYEQVGRWLDPLSTGIVVVALLGYAYRVITFRRRGRKA